MHFSDLTAYAATLTAITLAPGPLLFLLMARAAGRDLSGALSFGLGLVLGDVCVVVLVAMGLGVWIDQAPGVMVAAELALLGYILYLAWGIWRSGLNLSEPCDADRKGLLASLCFGAGASALSPQTVGLYALLLPRLTDLDALTAAQLGWICLWTGLILAACLALVIGSAGALRQVAQSPKHMGRLNRVLATALGLSGIWMVAL